MTRYRRLFIPNSTYFFTIVTYKRREIFTSELAREILKTSILHVKTQYPFEIIAFVLLPDHFHALVSLPEETVDYSTRIRLIKQRFTQIYLPIHKTNIVLPKSMNQRNEKGIWQRRFWEHRIRDEKDLMNHMSYIHYNPVKHDYAQSPKDREYSTFHKYVKLGWYEEGWGTTEPESVKGIDCE